MEVLYWAIQMMQRKVNRVKESLELVLQPGRSLGTAVIMKLKKDVVDEMEALVHDSL
jgi:hypothetical protein